jgi:predicted ATPase
LRAFAPAEIATALHDRFRLLTGGSRTAVRRQQTLRASVDWSHALLTEPERVLFRRLAAFAGGFGLPAADAVAAGDSLLTIMNMRLRPSAWIERIIFTMGLPRP